MGKCGLDCLQELRGARGNGWLDERGAGLQGEKRNDQGFRKKVGKAQYDIGGFNVLECGRCAQRGGDGDGRSVVDNGMLTEQDELAWS